MIRIALGQYSISLEPDSPDYYNSLVFAEPDRGVFGIVYSLPDPYLIQLSEGHAGAAFDILRAAFTEHKGSNLTGTELLQKVLRAVQLEFSKIDLDAHLTRMGLATGSITPEPAHNVHCKPAVSIILLQLIQRQLSIVSIGDFPVYRVNPTERELIFRWNILTDGDIFTHALGPQIRWRENMPKMKLLEMQVTPGDLILVTTLTMKEFIDLSQLDQLISPPGCAPESVGQHLRTILDSMFTREKSDGSVFKNLTSIHEHGGAWAIACVEE